MLLNQGYFYTVTLMAVSFGLLLIGLVISYVGQLKKNEKLRNEWLKSKKSSEKEVQKILHETRKSSEKIIQKAMQKAQEIIDDSVNFGEEEKNKLRSELVKLSKNIVDRYDKTMSQSLSEMSSLISSSSKDMQETSKKALVLISDEAQKQTKLFRSNAVSEMSIFQTKLLEIIENERKRISTELSEYKAKRMSEIEKNVLSLVKIISKDVFGKSISSKDQRDLIISSLEKAKKDGMFGK